MKGAGRRRPLVALLPAAAVLALPSLGPGTPGGGRTAPAAATESATSVLAAYDPEGAEVERWGLPRSLREASGLATDGRGRLLVHDDERARVVVLDPRTAEPIAAFTLGAGGVRGDFEGIARAGERLFLVTSTGTVAKFRAGAHGAAVPFRAVPTGLGRRCEVEGLAFDARTGLLLLPCKEARERTLRGGLTVFAVPADSLSAPPRIFVRVGEAGVAAALEVAGVGRRFRPSAVEVHPETGRLILASGPDRALLELERNGRVVAAVELPKRHRQPEGLTFGADGALYLVDEGDGGRARLTRIPASRRP